MVVIWNEVGLSLIAPLRLMLRIKAIDYSLVANAAHNWHKDFQVSVSIADLLFKTWLKEPVESLCANIGLTLAIKNAEKVELIDAEGKLVILLKTLLLSILIFFILKDYKDVILHEKAPI